MLIYGTTIRPVDCPQPNIKLAIQKGYRGIDTASSIKSHSELQNGKAIRRLQDDHVQDPLNPWTLWVQTKYTPPIGHPGARSDWPYSLADSHALRVLKSFARSHNNLGVDAIDAYFLHCMLDNYKDTLEAWDAMQQMASRGGARQLGLSNVCICDLEYVWKSVDMKPAIVQNRLSPGEGGYDVEVAQFCKENGIMYQIFGIFSHDNYGLVDSNPVKEVMAATEFTKHQALIRLLFGAADKVGLVLCILDGTTNGIHMEENLKASGCQSPIDYEVMSCFLRTLGWENL